MGDIFNKPYLSKTSSVFPYSAERLIDGAIFPGLVRDCGAFLFANDVLGVSDGDEMLRKTMDGSIFDYYRRDGVIHWDELPNRFMGNRNSAEYEAYLWLLRLYVLFPVAQAYAKTKDEKYARKWFEIAENWAEGNPYNEDVRYIWKDMQLTWRLLAFIYGIYLMGDCDSVSEARWKRIYDLIAVHVNEMVKESELWLSSEKPFYTNHMVQKATGLLYAGILLPELCESEYVISIAKKVLEAHLHGEMYEAGVSMDHGMAYKHFVARLFLEAELLLSKNGYESIEGLAESVRKQCEFLYNFSAQDGKNILLGDTYSLDVEKEIDFINSVFPLDFPRKRKSAVCYGAGFAVLRNEMFELFIDAQKLEEYQMEDNFGTHIHFGKLHFILYANGKPVVIDCGCSNYDRALLKIALSTEAGHNVVTCRELPTNHDMVITDVREKTEIVEFIPDVKCVVRNTVRDAGGNTYTWNRTFSLEENRVVITDEVASDKKYHFVSYLNLASSVSGYCHINCPEKPISEDGKSVFLRDADVYRCVKTTTPFRTELGVCCNSENRIDYCHKLIREFFVEEFTEETVISIEKVDA